MKWSENNPQNEIGEVVNTCTIAGTNCFFPYCENDLSCDKKEEHMTDKPVTVQPIIHPPKKEVKPISNVKLYFQCQEKINRLDQQREKLIQEKEEIFQKVKTDIETVFLALDCEELGTNIELTKDGVKITYPVKVFNDYQSTLIDTDLFTQLNNVMGRKGKLNIMKEIKTAGNYVRNIEINYSL